MRWSWARSGLFLAGICLAVTNLYFWKSTSQNKSWEERNFDNGVLLYGAVAALFILIAAYIFSERKKQKIKAKKSSLVDKKRLPAMPISVLLLAVSIMQLMFGLMIDMLNRHGI